MAARNLVEQIGSAHVEADRIAAWWLGGSGFVLKNDCGATVYIDPYLSNSVEAIFGLGRAFPTLISPEDANPDLVISTHWHEDHLDPGTIPAIARGNPATRFIMSPSAASHALSWGVPKASIELLMPGEQFEAVGFTVTHVPARHEAGIPGWETPDAMGVIVSTRDASFYHTGDTEYLSAIPRSLTRHLDVVTACVNGATGNMNAKEAALLAVQLAARTVIPHHHLLWSKDSSDSVLAAAPGVFERTYRQLGGDARVVIPVLGEAIAV